MEVLAFDGGRLDQFRVNGQSIGQRDHWQESNHSPVLAKGKSSESVGCEFRKVRGMQIFVDKKPIRGGNDRDIFHRFFGFSW